MELIPCCVIYESLMQGTPQCYNLYFQRVVGIEERIIEHKS